MRTWTLKKINEVWALQSEIDREHDQHRIYGTDLELGRWVMDACNAAEQREEEAINDETDRADRLKILNPLGEEIAEYVLARAFKPT